MTNNSFNMNPKLTPDLLYKRHRLSYPQIDSLLGTNNSALHQKDILDNFKTIREFIIVTDEFRKMDIRFIPLKGPLLSQRIYNDATIRRSHDLDILIDFNNISLIFNYLIKRGYRACDELSEENKERLRLYIYAKHISFFHPQKKVCFEIHWKIFIDWRIFNLDFDSIYQHITTKQVFMSREFRVLNPENDLFYLLVHGTDHKWQRLKWLLDVNDYMLNIPFDRSEVYKLAKKYNVSVIFPLYDSIASMYLPAPPLFDSKLKIPALLLRICIKHITASEVVFTAKNITYSIYGYIYGFFLYPDLDNKIGFIKNKLICSADSKIIKTSNPMLLILYRPFGYLYRQLEGIWKRIIVKNYMYKK